jgi:YVTN family beta-propeller protein
MRLFVLLLSLTSLYAQLPKTSMEAADLPNGWKLSPAGKQIRTEDMVLGLSSAPDGKMMVAVHSGFNPHGMMVVSQKTEEPVQRIPMKSAWMGLAWSLDGSKLYVSGGNGVSRRNPTKAALNVYGYKDGLLTEKPIAELESPWEANQTYWSGLAHHPSKPLIFAANRGTGVLSGHVAVFDTAAAKLLATIPVEVNPYKIVLDAAGKYLYVSNWGSDSVSVIDVETRKTVRRIAVGDNPNDMTLAKDGRLYIACGNSNDVWVVDTKKMRAVHQISTAMHPNAPLGSTPNAVLLDKQEKMLFVANADNNNVAVVNIAEAEEYNVMGFIPTGWYPSSLALTPDGKKLYVGNGKGMGGYSNVRGPGSPLVSDGSKEGLGSIKQLMKGSVEIIDLANLKNDIKRYTQECLKNSPYSDELLTLAKAPKIGVNSIVPREVGMGSPIKHILYIIRENRTYDQVFGDLKQGNGDPRLTIFPRKVTPNAHKLAEEYVLFDNLYCDGEVSVDGHSWSNSAYATDFNEKLWPVTYGGWSSAFPSAAYIPSAGHLWDLAQKKGLTYRSYGEYASRSSDGTTMEAAQGVGGLLGHVSQKFKLPGMRDTDNARVFLEELDAFEANFDSKDPLKRLPNFSVMSLGEDHTQGTQPGAPTPVAAVANNDWAVGQIVERLSKSKYWSETAIFIIEDDAQDGPDHVDARRTVGLVVSPYSKKKGVDSTLYTTSSMIRTMELLLGLPPMTQYDAAATPMYAAFTNPGDLTPYTLMPPEVDVNAKNTLRAWGARESMQMDFSAYDRTPMFALNEIVWKSVKGPKSEMPLPVRRFHWRRD